MNGCERCQVIDHTEATSWYGKLWYRFLNNFLPVKIKRMIFLTCVFAYVSDIDTPTDETIRKLNEILNLANDDDAIKLPIVIRHAIWKTLEEPIQFDDGSKYINVKDIVREKKPSIFDQFLKVLIKRAPSWMVYGSDKTLENDLRVLFDRFAY
jgi:hypothetical protein